MKFYLFIFTLSYLLNTSAMEMEEKSNSTKPSIELKTFDKKWNSAFQELKSLGTKLKINEALDKLAAVLNEYANKGNIFGNQANIIMVAKELNFWPCLPGKVTRTLAIYNAIEFGHVDCVKALLRHKINLDIVSDKQTPLEFARETAKKQEESHTTIVLLLERYIKEQKNTNTTETKSIKQKNLTEVKNTLALEL